MAVSYLKRETSPQQTIFNKEDWSSAYCNVEKELDHAEVKLVKGSIPKQISGTFYRNGPGRLERGGRWVHHPFDGELNNRLKLLKPSTPNNEKLIMVTSKSHRNKETEDYISRFNVLELKGAGSSLKFCLLASGEADIYPRLGRTMEWDTAAGQAILRASGGNVVNFENHKPLLYGKPSYENPFFVAYVPGVNLKGNE